MKLRQMTYPYPFLPAQERAAVLPKRNVCSIAPAEEPSDYLYSGNGSHRIDVSGQPYCDELAVTQELLYEPQWEKTPNVPDLRPYLADIRKYVLAGKPELADALIDKAQREAGLDRYMKLDADIVYPTGTLRVHKACWLTFSRPDGGETKNYLRWVDMMSGKICTHWETPQGVFENEYLAAYQGDLVAARFSAPAGLLDLDISLRLPGGPGPFGRISMAKSSHTLEKTPELFKLAFAYNPEYGRRGYVSVIRFIPQGGTVTVTDDGVCVRGADRLVVLAKAVRVEHDFSFGCENAIADEFEKAASDFDSYVAGNLTVLGERMSRSQLTLGKEEDYVLSGEELLRLSHSQEELYPALMDKLYDMGRFYQIIDTGEIPPMWGQHNINTNLQVCAGNNTGLFDEMDSYFRYYERKFDDFRTNARLLFGARGLLASVHCDYDTGLYYHFSRTYPHYCWTGCLGWIYNEFWGYYLCTGDLDFLRNRVVPALKEIALFFEDYACDRDENGKVIFYPSFSPEDPTPNPDYVTVTCKSINPTRINSVMDIAICREVLTNLIEACNTLGIEQDQIAHWQQQIEDLPDYLLDEEGGLKEWAWPTIEENYNHRHVSHHYDVWPGRAVTPELDPETAEAIKISNRKRGQQDDSAHGIIHRALCAIRLKDVEEMEQNLSQLIGHGFVRRNLSTAHFPYRGQFPDLQGAMPAILLEMCVFSMPGTIEFLPAMPQCFPTGELCGIWLYTWAKLNTIRWNASGMYAEIVSQKAQKLTLRIRRPVASFTINGKCYTPEGDHVEYVAAEGEKLTVEISFAD